MKFWIHNVNFQPIHSKHLNGNPNTWMLKSFALHNYDMSFDWRSHIKMVMYSDGRVRKVKFIDISHQANGRKRRNSLLIHFIDGYSWPLRCVSNLFVERLLNLFKLPEYSWFFIESLPISHPTLCWPSNNSKMIWKRVQLDLLSCLLFDRNMFLFRILFVSVASQCQSSVGILVDTLLGLGTIWPCRNT